MFFCLDVLINEPVCVCKPLKDNVVAAVKKSEHINFLRTEVFPVQRSDGVHVNN